MTRDFISLLEVGAIAGAAVLYAVHRLAHFHDNLKWAMDDIDRELEAERAAFSSFDRFTG